MHTSTIIAEEADVEKKENITNQEEQQPTVAPNVDLKEVAPLPEPAPEITQQPIEESEIEVDISDQDQTKQEETAEVEKFIILGSEVPKNTSTRLAWSPQITIAGITLPTPVLVINGQNSGPTVCLTSAIHGDELNGIEVVRRVMYDIKPEDLSGKVIGVPIVNLQGFQRGSRYLPDRRDLNRYFPGTNNGSLASRIANSLFNEVIKHCTYLIDIHTGSLRRTNLPQIRANMENPNVAEFVKGFDKIAVVHHPGNPGMLANRSK